jgi:hypothetical protein
VRIVFINLSTEGGSFSMVLDSTLNGENMRFWLTFFIRLVYLLIFLFNWHEEHIIQQLKAWSFRRRRNLVHTQSNSDNNTALKFDYLFYTHIPLYIYMCLYICTKFYAFNLKRMDYFMNLQDHLTCFSRWNTIPRNRCKWSIWLSVDWKTTGTA